MSSAPPTEAITLPGPPPWAYRVEEGIEATVRFVRSGSVVVLLITAAVLFAGAFG